MKREDEIPRLTARMEESPEETLAFLLRLLKCGAEPHAAAERLLQKFGSISGILNAPPEILAETEGVSPWLAGAISAMPDLFRVYLDDSKLHRTRIIDSQTAYNVLCDKFFGLRREILVLLVLDSKAYQRYLGVVYEGSAHAVPVYARDIARIALLYEGDTIYLAHNHPSGNVVPSWEDFSAMKELEMVLSGLGISIADHFIFGGEDYYSMRASGMIERIRSEARETRRSYLQ